MSSVEVSPLYFLRQYLSAKKRVAPAKMKGTIIHRISWKPEYPIKVIVVKVNLLSSITS